MAPVRRHSDGGGFRWFLPGFVVLSATALVLAMGVPDADATTGTNDLTLSQPSNITVDLTSSSQTGSVVTYARPAATDPDDSAAPPAPTCTPASGSTFAIGVTTVTCREDLSAAVSADTNQLTVDQSKLQSDQNQVSLYESELTTLEETLATDEQNVNSNAETAANDGTVVTIAATALVSDLQGVDAPFVGDVTSFANDATQLGSDLQGSAGPTQIDDDLVSLRTDLTALDTDFVSNGLDGSQAETDLLAVASAVNALVDDESQLASAMEQLASDQDSFNILSEALSAAEFAVTNDQSAVNLDVNTLANDEAENGDSVNFTVSVLGAAGQLVALRAAVANVPPGTSLSDKLGQAETYLAAKDTKDACGAVKSFVNEVMAYKWAPAQQTLATQWGVAAKRIDGLMAC